MRPGTVCLLDQWPAERLDTRSDLVRQTRFTFRSQLAWPSPPRKAYVRLRPEASLASRLGAACVLRERAVDQSPVLAQIRLSAHVAERHRRPGRSPHAPFTVARMTRGPTRSGPATR